MLLSEKGAVITGAASGIGAASARKFLEHGARIVISDINADLGHAFAKELDSDRVLFIPADVSCETAVSSLMTQANEWLRAAGTGLDVLFNNAGIGGRGLTPELDSQTWETVIGTNLNSVFYGCRSAIPFMVARGGGSIINNASMSGLSGDFGFSAYSAAKGGVINYTKTLALDHGVDRIRVNALCPGVIDTPLTSIAGMKQMYPEFTDLFLDGIALGRVGQPEEIAGSALYLASDLSSYMTGASLLVDGGRLACTGQPSLEKWLARRT